MANYTDIETNDREVVFIDGDGNFAVVIAASAPQGSRTNWKVGDWEISFSDNSKFDPPVHFSLENVAIEDQTVVESTKWQTPIENAIKNRAMYLILKHIGINDFNSAGTIESDTSGISSPAGATINYFSFFEEAKENVGGDIIISEDTPWHTPWFSPRPKDPYSHRWTVAITKALVDEVNQTKGAALNASLAAQGFVEGFTEKLLPFNEEKPFAPENNDTRADKRFRQTFDNVLQFEVVIDLLVSSLEKYDEEIKDSVWFYTYPGEFTVEAEFTGEGAPEINVADEPVEVDLKLQASFIRELGENVTEFLFRAGHDGNTPFEIGFQEFVERNKELGSLNGQIKEEVILGNAPGIRYIGAPTNDGGVNIYTPKIHATRLGVAAADSLADADITISVSEGLNTVFNVDNPTTPVTVFNEFPFTNGRTRYLLANLRQMVENDLGGRLPIIPSKEETKIIASQTAAEVAKNPCGDVPSIVLFKDPTPVDVFVEKRLIPTPEKNFRTSTITDFAIRLGGFDRSLKALNDIDVEINLTKEDVLEELVEQRNTNLNDYVADIVWSNLPSTPNKIRSLDDAWRYVLSKIDLPTLIAKFLACKGLDVSVDDMIEYICDEMIRTVDRETDGGITAVIDYMESGEFVPGGEFIDLRITDIVFELKLAVRRSIEENGSGTPADEFLRDASRDSKRLVCFALASGPFIAVSALVEIMNWFLNDDDDEKLDSVPARKKCDTSFSFPDDLPLLNSIWDLVLKKVEKKLEEQAMEWFEAEIVKPVRDWVWEIIETCGEDDEFQYGEIPPADLAPRGFEEVVTPLFPGGDNGEGEFLEGLLNLLTPTEICILLNQDVSYENEKFKKVINFILDYVKEPANNAPFTMIGTEKKPGRLASRENIINFFNSIAPKLDTSVCDRLNIIPNRPVSDLCEDLSTSPKEIDFISALEAQGMSKDSIEKQLLNRRESRKRLIQDALKRLADTGNISQKLRENARVEINNALKESLRIPNATSLAGFFSGLKGISKTDMNEYIFIMSNIPFIQRMIADMETFLNQDVFIASSIASRNRYHNYNISTYSSEYLDKKAQISALTISERDSRCEEWRRHRDLLLDIKKVMELDLFEGANKYWNYGVPVELGLVNGENITKFTNAWDLYQSTDRELTRRNIIDAMWMRHPHTNLIEKYNNLTEQEFNDLATIAFRYYSRFEHDYTNLDDNSFTKIKLRSGERPYGSFYYDPLTENGGSAAWWGSLSQVNFRTGINVNGRKPWQQNYPGQDPEKIALPLFQLIQHLEDEEARNEGKYYIFNQITDENRWNVNIKFANQKVTRLKRYGNWVPFNPSWSTSDLKTALVQLLLFVWDRGIDEMTDWPIFAPKDDLFILGKAAEFSFESGAWKRNFYGGHAMRALGFYLNGLASVPGYLGSNGEVIGDEVHLVEAEWVGEDASDKIGFWGSGWVPKEPIIDTTTNELIPPNTVTVDAEAWKNGLHGSTLTIPEDVEATSDQLIILNPKTGRKAHYIPAPRPTPWRLFCRVERPRQNLLADIDTKPVYDINYRLLSQKREAGVLIDQQTNCLTDEYNFSIKHLNTGNFLTNFRNQDNIKLLNFDTVQDPNDYSFERAKNALEKIGYNSSWEKLKLSNGPAAPQIFQEMVWNNIDGFVQNKTNPLLELGGLLPGEASGLGFVWATSSPYVALYDILQVQNQGIYNLYGTIFRDLLKTMSQYTIEYGLGSNFDSDQYSNQTQQIIQGVRELISRFFGSGQEIMDNADIRGDSIEKQQQLMNMSDLFEVNSVPSVGKTLLTYPEPGLLRMLVRVFIIEKFLKSVLVCGSFDAGKVGSTSIIKEFVFDSMKADEEGKDNYETIAKLKFAEEMEKDVGEVTLKEAIFPIIEKEAPIIAARISNIFKAKIKNIEDILVLPQIYDLASMHPASEVNNKGNISTLQIEAPDAGIPKIIRDEIAHTNLRFYDLVGNQLKKGIVVEKYIKVKFKKSLEELSNSSEFFDKWLEWPIEFRGYSPNPTNPDGSKLPAYISVEDFSNQYEQFFKFFGYEPEEVEKGISIFDWKQISNSKGFREELQKLHDKVHSNQKKQGPGDKVGSNSYLDLKDDSTSSGNANNKNTSISRSAEIQRHIALMERLLHPYFKSRGYKHPNKRGFMQVSKAVQDSLGLSSVDPRNQPNDMNAIMPGTKSPNPYHPKNWSGDDWSEFHTEADATAKQKQVKEDLIRWSDLSAQDQQDLAVIAFRFYTRYYFGDFTAFTFNPLDTETLKSFHFAKNGLYDFFKRKGHLDKSVDPRTGLRVPGSMYFHAFKNPMPEGDPDPELRAAYTVDHGTSLQYHIPPTFYDLFKTLNAQQKFGDYDYALNSKNDLNIIYDTPHIQEGASSKTKQFSYKLPDIMNPDDLPLLDSKGTIDTLNVNSFLRNLARLLCYPYEVGNARTMTVTAGEADDQTYSWTIPDNQRWDNGPSKAGIWTNSNMGENYRAIFGGHLYWALEYYKNGLEFLQEVEQGIQYEVIGGQTKPTPLDIFVKDFQGNDTLVSVSGISLEEVSDELQDIGKRPLTDFADVKYGLRLSYIMPPDINNSPNQFDYPLSSWASGRKNNNFWKKIKDSVTGIPADKYFWESGGSESRSDFYNTIRRTKMYYMKEAPGTIIEPSTNDVFSFPLLKYEEPANGETIGEIVANFNPLTLWSGMKKEDNFRILFDYVFPLQRILAMLMVRDSLNFDQARINLPGTPPTLNEELFSNAKEHIYGLIQLAARTSRDPALKEFAIDELTIEDLVEEIESLS